MTMYAFLPGVPLFVMMFQGMVWLIVRRWKSKSQEPVLSPEEFEDQAECERIREIAAYVNSLPDVPEQFVGGER